MLCGNKGCAKLKFRLVKGVSEGNCFNIHEKNTGVARFQSRYSIKAYRF